MAGIEETLTRLERAVARLERATERFGKERAAEEGALAAMKTDYAVLLETTDSVASRLDAAILRLDRALEA